MLSTWKQECCGYQKGLYGVMDDGSKKTQKGMYLWLIDLRKFSELLQCTSGDFVHPTEETWNAGWIDKPSRNYLNF